MAKATQSEFNTLKQIYEQIPGHSVNKAVQIFGEDKRSRTFSPRRVLKKKSFKSCTEKTSVEQSLLPRFGTMRRLTLPPAMKE